MKSIKEVVTKSFLEELVKQANDLIIEKQLTDRLNITFEGRKCGIERVTPTKKSDARFVDRRYILFPDTYLRTYEFVTGFISAIHFINEPNFK